ncbi:MAG: MFS transporter [Clostridia bacterium]|nr:MFS transporter [Clostridia bacterium]
MKHIDKNRNTLFLVSEGIAAAVILNLFSPFTQMFAKRMGAGDLHIALINSLPPLVAILVLIPCSILIERVADKKFVTGIMIVFNSIFYAIIAFTPNLPHELRVIVYVVLIGLMNWPGALYTTSWQSFFSYTFTDKEANRIYSLRSKYGAFFGLITVLLTGLLLSTVPKSDSDRILLYQFFYGTCFLISMVQVFFLSGIRQNSVDSANKQDSEKSDISLKDIKGVFANKPFMIFCACVFTFHIAWQMGWPLFFLYNADYIRVNEFQLGILNVASGLASFLSYPLWHKLAVKKGNSFVIIIGALGLTTNPFFYTGIMPFYVIVAVNIIVGAACAAFTMMLFCNLMEILPTSKKTMYISMYNTFINISGFIAPLLGIWMNRHTGIFRAMLIIGVLRTIGVGMFAFRWFLSLKEKENKSSAGQVYGRNQ